MTSDAQIVEWLTDYRRMLAAALKQTALAAGARMFDDARALDDTVLAAQARLRAVDDWLAQARGKRS